MIVTINKDGMKTKECVITDLFGILVMCECDKSCDIGEYLDYKTCKCRKRIIHKLVEECSENTDGNEMLYNETLDIIPLNVYKKVCSSSMVCIVSFIVFLMTSICICCVFIYFYWHLKKDNISTNFNVGYLNT